MEFEAWKVASNYAKLLKYCFITTKLVPFCRNTVTSFFILDTNRYFKKGTDITTQFP